MKENGYKDKALAYIDKGKSRWSGLTSKDKQKYTIIGCGAVLIIVVATLFFSMSKDGYVVLYPGIDQREAAQVFATLQDSGIPAQISSDGEVKVPKDSKNQILLELAGEFPKTAPNYGVYSNNSGFTATESDRTFYLNAQLQDRLQETIQIMEGVSSAIVTLNIASEDRYVWESNSQPSTASVTVTMRQGYKLKPEHAQTIKNLVSGSVPKLNPDNVVVIDAATMLEVKVQNDSIDTLYNLKRLDYEAEYERRLVEKVQGLLSTVYGPGGVQAIATVVLDYDRMLTEQMQYVPEDSNTGVKNHVTENYVVGGNLISGGVVGEENNTDIPSYETTGDGDGQYTDIHRDIDYSISYVKQQIEKGEALLKKASISVIVNEPNFTPEKQDQLINVVAKGTNIEPSNISVTNMDLRVNDVIPTGGGSITEFYEEYKMQILLTIGGLLVLIILTIILLSRRAKAKKKKKTDEELKREEELQKVLDEKRKIEEEKSKLFKAAEENATAENKVSTQIRDFAGQNPEITAALISEWLREEQ